MNLSDDSNVQGSEQGSGSSSGNGQNQQTIKKCSVCNGAEKINCEGCQATGQITCPDSGGFGKIGLAYCTKCSGTATTPGTGKITCPT
ncbi:MAG: hypothetical protein FJ150_06015 [Euryarchaeota archaeon]|nr:hypothetical protein [Euryarchaeota archaeon]